jgi:hypothetical protein
MCRYSTKVVDMKLLQKALLISAMTALPLAMAHAQKTPEGSTEQGEEIESSVPSENPPPSKSPNNTMPAPTGTAEGEAPYSTVPGTDKPATTDMPDQELHRSDTPASSTTPSTAGKAAPTAPSMETPPAGAPMRTGDTSKTNEGANTSVGTDKTTK